MNPAVATLALVAATVALAIVLYMTVSWAVGSLP